MYCSVCNNLYDVIDYDTKDETKKKENSSVFNCLTCNTKKHIPNGTVIYEKVSKKYKNSYKKENLHELKKSKILLNTREYTCPNDKCESHKNPEKREASVFRLSESADVIYICNTCNTKF